MSDPAVALVEAADVFTLAQARRAAVMLGISAADLSIGTPLPRGWHFAMLAGETPRHSLRSDGFPGLGVPMPQLGRPRLLLGQRSTVFEGDLLIGAQLKRQSAITDIVEKTGRNGPLSIVSARHFLSGADETGSVLETQTYYLAGLPAPAGTAAEGRSKPPATTALPDGRAKIVRPDELMLFQYSALGFNTHRIHFDRDYATRVEGHPDIVVNGGLATLLATEFLRADLGLRVKSLSALHKSPLYVNRPITILLQAPAGGTAKMLLLDSDGILAAELVVAFDGL